MHINSVNNCQTNFEARSFNAKHIGKTPHPRYRLKQKIKTAENPILETSKNKTNSINSSDYFIDSYFSPDYDWRKDMNHISHGKEIEPTNEFFNELSNYYKEHEFRGIDYDPMMDIY